MKIKHKLMLGFICLAMLIAATGYVALQMSRTALENSIGEHSAAFTSQVLDNVYMRIQRRTEQMQAYSTDELLRKYIVLSNAHFQNMTDPCAYILHIDKKWVNGADVTGILDELTSNKLAAEIKSQQIFYKNKYGYPLFAEIIVTNKFGATISLTNKTTDYYQADDEWWPPARQNGLYISDVKYEESSETYSSDIAVRVDDANGNFLGVIKAVLNVDETINIINKAKMAAGYKTTQFCLINNDGLLIYSTNGGRFHKDMSNELDHCFGKNTPTQLHYIIGRQNGDKDLLLAHAHSTKNKDSAALGWTLLMQTDASEIFAPITGLRSTMLLMGLVILGLALLASSITYRSIVIPLAQLKNATLQIASGNLNTNLTTIATDEIGQLANSFQRMATQLKKTISDLNDEINGRKLSEEKLRENQQFLNSIFDSIQDGIVVLDKDLNIVKVNKWKEKFHSDIMPLVGKKCYETFQNRHEPCPSCPSVQALKTGKQATGTASSVRADQQMRFLELTAYPLKNADGTVAGVIEHVKDVTERKQIEDTLRESESRLKAIFDNIQTGVFIIDPESHKIVYANSIAARMVGASREQLVGSVCHKFICPAEKGHCPITDMDQKVDNAERVLLTAGGEKRQVIKTVVSVMLDGRKHLLESFIDVTEHKQAEQELEKLNKDLKAANEELSQANKQLHEFVHVAAHDLKTPVRGIGTLADWIAADYADNFNPQGKEQLRLLKVRVNRIDKLIDGMLQFSKIVRTRQKERQVNLNAQLSQLISEMKLPDNIEIAVDTLPGITCESEHMTQVFQNLLSNAVAFMNKPKGLIKIGCVEQGDFWKFYVNDNGPGIEQRHYDRIFKIFQTLPDKDESETAGIGLTITRKIVELYGGKIWVESQRGSGSTFFFTFPKKQEELVYADN